MKELAWCLLLLGACGKGGDLSLPGDGEPAGITVLEGDGQSGRVGTPLADPLVVQVTDSKGRPVEGATVTFELTSGGPGAEVVPPEKGTDADGKADARVVLGTSVGEQTGRVGVATTVGREPVEAAFTAVALSENANAMAAVSGDEQTGPAGSVLPKPLVVAVTDAFGNPVPGVAITWTPEGGGSVSASSVVTDQQGRASVDRTLGGTTGRQTTLASSEGLAGSPVTFVHTVVAGNAAGVSIVSGDNQTAEAGTQLPAPLVVQLTDENGNGVPGAAVTWVVSIGGGSVTPQNSITDAAGQSSAQWTLGPTPGDNRLDAVFSGTGLANFRATGTPAPGSLPARIDLNGGNGQSGTIGTTLSTPLSVKVTTGAGGPAAGVTVLWAVSGGGSVSSPTSVTNAGGIAQVVRTLGPNPGSQITTASAPGLSGSPVTFQSTATPGAPSALVLTTQPSASARNGVRLDQQPVIQVRDGAGHDLQVGGLEVTVSIAAGGGVLNGTTRQTTDASGRATFTDLSITGDAGKRTLIFAATNYSAATSNEIDVAATATRTTITGDSPDPSGTGDPVTVNFRVTSDGPTPTGTVSVSDGVDSCSGALQNGAGSCPVALRTAGNRTITATYAGGTGLTGSSGTAQHTVNAPPPPENKKPNADFEVSCADLTCTFTNKSTDQDGSIVSWRWQFGDGTSSSEANPAPHGYAAGGKYEVTLTVTDNGGAVDSKKRDANPKAPPPPNQAPTAAFTSSCSDLTCSFNSDGSRDSDGSIVSRSWTFGDGNSSDQRNPSHTYNAAGTPTVTLTVTDNNGATGTVSHTVTVTAPPPSNRPPTAAFTSSCSNLTCSFNSDGSSDSDGSIVSRSWTFGDGNSGNQGNPSHTYNAGGTYTVTLTVTDNDGATGTIPHNVTVAAPPPPNQPPTAAFTSSCSDLTCSFNSDGSNDSDGNIVSRSWTFGDGNSGNQGNPSHTYNAGGTYTVILTVTDNDGATGTVSHTVTVTAPPPPNQPPTAEFASSCTDLSCGFTDQSTDDKGIVSWSWNFGEPGSADNTSTSQNPSHTYSAGGTYTVTLTVTDGDAATGTISHTVTVVAPPPPNQAPGADFTWSCPDLNCQFTDASTDNDGTIASWSWDFGDGGTSVDQSPPHAYLASGGYNVTLTVTDNAGASSAPKTETITVP